MEAPGGSRLHSRFIVAEEHAGLRSEVFLALKVPLLSRRRIRQKIQEGEALLNGRRHAPFTRVQRGDRVEVHWRQASAAVSRLELSILYEDEFMIAVDKPAGVAVHPTGRKQSGTLIQGIQERYRDEIEHSLARGDPGCYPRLINRLDLFTSGAVLVAKKREPLLAMQELIARGGIHKRYLALAHGIVEPARGMIDLPLGKAEGSRIDIKQAVRPDGSPSATEYEVLEHRQGHTLLYAHPLTGRQHQIRVHFAARGHPLWGDLIYGHEELFLRYCANGCELDETLPPRQGLHAERLAFRHPLTGEQIEILAPLPPDFKAILLGISPDFLGSR